jgi:hypothetical protein
MIEFEKFVDYLKSLCENKDNSNQLFYWITPIPNNTTMSPENKNEFEKIIKDTNNIITSSGYNIFDRYDLWRRRADLVVTKSGHFSLHGKKEEKENILLYLLLLLFFCYCRCTGNQ